MAALDRLSGKVRERIGESLKSIRAGQPLDQVTTGSLEALRLYTEGAKLSEHGRDRQAVERLEQAIALDSGFAMAWRKLAVALGNSRGSEDRVVSAITRAWQYRDRLPEIERQLTTAFYHSTADSDPAKEEAAYRRVLAIRPDNYVALNNLSLLLSKLGRPVEAESLIVQLVRSNPDPGNAMLQLVLAQVLQQHDADARRTLDSMARRGPGLPIYVWGRGIMLSAMRDYEGAERAFADIERNASDPDLDDLSAAYQGLARVAFIRGRLGEAERQTRRDMEVSERRGVAGTALVGASELALAAVTYRRDSAGALRILDAALKSHPLSSIPALDRPGANPRAGVRPRRPACEGAPVPRGVRVPGAGRDSPGRSEWYRARGWIALTEGPPRDAVTAFVQGRRADSWPNLLAWDEGVAYERAGLPDSALAAYQRAAARGAPWKSIADQWGLAPSLKRLGELYEARGDRQRALENYGKFVELWKEADPELQPAVREVRGRMGGLAGEVK